MGHQNFLSRGSILLKHIPSPTEATQRFQHSSVGSIIQPKTKRKKVGIRMTYFPYSHHTWNLHRSGKYGVHNMADISSIHILILGKFFHFKKEKKNKEEKQTKHATVFWIFQTVISSRFAWGNPWSCVCTVMNKYFIIMYEFYRMSSCITLRIVS